MEAVNLMKTKEDMSPRSPHSEGVSDDGSDQEVFAGLLGLAILTLPPGWP